MYGASNLSRVATLFAGRYMSLARQLACGALFAYVGMISLANVAYAIPSPELVVGSISSVSQLIALVSAMLGGGAAMVGVRARARGANGGANAKGLVRLAVVLFVVCIAMTGLNIYQYHTNSNAVTQRLQATLLRPATAPGTKIKDAELKVMSLKRQNTHELGIETEDVARLIAESAAGREQNLLLLDVRETAENEMGTIPGAQHIRFPDIRNSDIDFTGRKAVLLCHNGNRSSETCERLAAMGIDCRFIVGGIEKWIVEGRQFTDPNVRGLSDLRSVPAYNNQRVLLDTPDVRSLINAEGAIFVDVRYPKEFDSQHLPGAINIPLRKTPTKELMSRISALPKKPIVAACYDRRGCFGSEVLGLELTRAGYDYRGRYTLPWEYYIPKQRKAHIEAWLQKTQISSWQKGVNALAALISWLATYTGLVMAIVLMAILSRLLILPFSWKAEQDQITANAVSDELEVLKKRLAHDPKRLARAIKSFYAKHGLTPLRNLIALLFLPVMAITVSSVQLAATELKTSLWWLKDIAAPDPLYALPVIFGLTAGIYLHIAVAKTHRHYWYVWLLGFPLLTVTALLLGGAANIYLVSSILLLLLQRSFVVGAWTAIPRTFQRARMRWNRWHRRKGLVPLDYPEQLIECGNKAFRLAQLRAVGVNVPNGIVLTANFLERFTAQSKRKRRRTLDRIWRKVDAAKVAVRSSAAAEDGGTHSFAGVYDSILDVNRVTLEDAVQDVISSFQSNRAESYGADGEAGNILVQEMIDADFAGVLFTQDPNAPGLMLLEMVEGTADDLVSGRAVPEVFRFGRKTHRIVEAGRAPMDMAPLLEIGRVAETLFQCPQDIEWTFKDDTFQIVQSRDITTSRCSDPVEQLRQDEWNRILQRVDRGSLDGPVLALDETSEVLPQPTPLSLSLMQRLWASGGSVDLACRQLGLNYDPVEDSPSQFVTLFGSLYVDLARKAVNQAELTRASQVRLKKGIESIGASFTDEFLPEFDREMRLLEVTDFAQLTTDNLLHEIDSLIEGFVTGTHVQVEVINIAASYYLGRAREELEAAGREATRFLGGAIHAGPAKVLADAAHAESELRPEVILKGMGHRAVFDYELSEPRYAEAPEHLKNICNALNVGSDNADHQDNVDLEIDGLAPGVAQTVKAARRYQELKEWAKHESLRHLAVLRRAIVALDHRLDLNGGAFYLTSDELVQLGGEDAAYLIVQAAERMKRFDTLSGLSPEVGSTMSLHELECATSLHFGAGQTEDDACRGTRVAGSDIVEGHARVIPSADAKRGSDIANFQDGEIIVCSMVHPAWLPYVVRSGGIVSEVGGWLSHMAIIAREHNVPMIVGAKGLNAISDGNRLRLCMDGSVLVLDHSQSAEPPTIVVAAE